PIGHWIGGAVDRVKENISHLYGTVGTLQRRTLDWAVATNNRPWSLEMNKHLSHVADAKNSTAPSAKADHRASAPVSPWLPRPGRSQMIQVHSLIHMDREKIAKAVTTHQARAANRPSTGAPLFDPTMGLLPIGMN